ncbi:MAG TPA: DUF3168 domain-containing protein [Pirellulales bacterium]|nr:DUF3168 domain-containing protein [Pirellulales bacterium]
MSLEQAIHNRWATDFLLAGLLPAERLSTGAARGETSFPYVVLSRRENQVLARTSSGTSIDRAVVRFAIWSADLDEAKEIARAVAHRFERVDFPLDEGNVLNMQRLQETETQADDSSWLVEIDYTVIHRHAPATFLG